MATKIRRDDLRKNFKSLLIWENKHVTGAVNTQRKHKKSSNPKVDERRVIYDSLHHKSDDRESREVLEDDPIKPLANPSDPLDDFNVFWNPHELLDATKALATYNVKGLYKKNPYTVTNTLHLIFLIFKYKPLLKDLLAVGEYFQRFPEDSKDENIVFIALFDILCRGNGLSLENEMDASLRMEYKNIGLKVVYMQVEQDKVHYFEQVHDRLSDMGVSSVHNLLPPMVPMQIKIEFPMIFDIWINKSYVDVWPEGLLEEAGFKRAGTRTSSGLTYNEITDLPYFYELGVPNYSDFVQTYYYRNHVFIPTDRNHCLAMAQLVKQLYKGGIQKGTVIQTHILSLGATAYFAQLLDTAFSSTMKLKVFGADKMKTSFENYFDLLNLNNVKVFSERFYIVNCRKKDIASTTCVLVNPETVFNPALNLIKESMNRGCDIVYLESAYEMFSENDVYDYSFVNQHIHDLKELAKCNLQRAFSIPKVKFVVYQSFDTRETANDNLGLYVIKYTRECSHTNVAKVKENMSPTEAEDANYKYCKKLDLYFRQGNTPDCVVSPELWGSKPPFITIIYRVDPVIFDTETEGEKHRRYSASQKRSSPGSFSVKSRGSYSDKYPLYTRDKLLGKVNVNEKILGESPQRGPVRRSQSSTISSIKRDSMTLLQARQSPPDFKKMILSEVMSRNKRVSTPSEKGEAVIKKKLKKKRSKKIVREKKDVLLNDQIQDTSPQQVSESEIQKKQALSSSFFKTKEKSLTNDDRLSNKESILDALSRNEVVSADSQVTSESKKLSQKPESPQFMKTSERIKLNKRSSKKESILTEDVPTQVKSKSSEKLNKDQSNSKYFSQTSKNKRNKDSRTTKKDLYMVQHSHPSFKEIVNPMAEHRNLPKKSSKTNQSKELPRNYLKVKKEPCIIAFGTIVRPKSSPVQQNEKNHPLKKENITSKKKDYNEELSSATCQQKSIKKQLVSQTNNSSVVSQQKLKKKDSSIKSNDGVESLKYHIDTRKQLNNMQKRFKEQIVHGFQTHFFHIKKQSDIDEPNRPSSSVSWKTYAKMAHKVSGLNLIKLLKEENKQKVKRRKRRTSLKKSRSWSSSMSADSKSRENVNDEENKVSRKSDSLLWDEYEAKELERLLEMNRKESKLSGASMLMELDRNEKTSLTSSLLLMNQKELYSSAVLSPSAVSSYKNKEKTSPKRKTSKYKMKSRKKKKYGKASKIEEKNESDESDEGPSQKESKRSLIKVVLENSEGTQTKPLRKNRAYDTGTQVDNLAIYMSLTGKEEHHKNLQFFTDLIHRSTVSSTYLIPRDNEGEDMISKRRRFTPHTSSSHKVVFTDKGEIKTDLDQTITVSKIMSWFRKLESQAPIPRRVSTYTLRRIAPTKKTVFVSKLGDKDIIEEEDIDDMIVEGVDDIPPLVKDYKIDESQSILAQMKMYDAGERNLNKLISTDQAEFIDFTIEEDKEMEEDVDKPVPEDREEILALNKNLLKLKADELDLPSFTDDDGYEEEDSFDMETKGKDMHNLLTRLVDNIFEADIKTARRITAETASLNTSVEPVKESTTNFRDTGFLEDSDEQLQSHSFVELWKNTSREEWNKQNREKENKPMKEKETEEVVEDFRLSGPEIDPVSFSVYDIIFKKTPTEGLSPLARELYEIRDAIEFYLHSRVEPLDWRVMIDRHAED
ncbi:myosin-2 heavy chain isoform X2 [Halyomorpha halys]|uniref:myosin-2 heavy chain isoform X2 n=1 Tax=Halyomorpha halys TaxID=286706 RepID=UPI0006D4D6E2|nr:uncharacterized protein LOC106686233 isoform X2 [Halyomorpha halys]